MKEKINILGEEWTIKYDEPLNCAAGDTDFSVRTIRICSHEFDEKTKVWDNKHKDLEKTKKQVMRHECLHAIFNELGIDLGYGMHEEYNINLLSMLYPKIKKIFEELGIED